MHFRYGVKLFFVANNISTEMTATVDGIANDPDAEERMTSSKWTSILGKCGGVSMVSYGLLIISHYWSSFSFSMVKWQVPVLLHIVKL